MSKELEEKQRIIAAQKRYLAAAHAMQSGVAMEHSNGSDDGSPKHLRVGVNSALCDHGALVKLLISKGIITDAEYFEAIADMMEEEVKKYEERLNERYGGGNRIHLG